MVLVNDPANDEILEQLRPEARYAWLNAVGHCVRYRTDLITPHELQRVDPGSIEEWEGANLAQRLPFGHVRMLGRPELWDFEVGH